MENEVLYIKLDDIIPNRFQPREVFDEKALNELADSIRQHGVIEPIIVRPVGNKFEIVAGERRYKASALAGLTKIPAIVKNMDDKESSLVAFIENEHRRDVSAIEKARTSERLLKNNNMTQEELATSLGISQSTLSNRLRLLELPLEVQESLMKNEISERHARSLLGVNDAQKQIELLKKIKEKRMTVRELESEIKEMNNGINNNSFMNNEIPNNDGGNGGFRNFLNNYDNNMPQNNNSYENLNNTNNYMNNEIPNNDGGNGSFKNFLNNYDNNMPQNNNSYENLNNTNNYMNNEIPNNDGGNGNFMNFLNNYDNNIPQNNNSYGNLNNTNNYMNNEIPDNNSSNGSFLNNYENNMPIDNNQSNIDNSYLNHHDIETIDNESDNSISNNFISDSNNVMLNNVNPPITSNFDANSYIEDTPDYVDVSKNDTINSVDEIIDELKVTIDKIKSQSKFKIDTDEINFDDIYQVTIKIDKRDL